MSEEPVRFSSGSADLYGMLHSPAADPRGTVLLCTPDGEERAWSHRTYLQLARTLARQGFGVFRFEYAGHGESSDAYESTSVDTRVADILAARSWLERRTGAETPVVVASRLGAAFALEAHAQDPRILKLVLWEPVFDVRSYVRNLIRVNLTSQMVIYKQVVKTTEELMAELRAGGTVSANGYGLTQALVDDLERLRPQERLARFSGDALILTTPSGRIPESPAEVVRMPFMPFWKEPKTDMTVSHALIRETMAWIDRHSAKEAS